MDPEGLANPEVRGAHVIHLQRFIERHGQVSGNPVCPAWLPGWLACVLASTLCGTPARLSL